jgi:hypothetical protein
VANWSREVNEADDRGRCARCGGTIDDDAAVILIVYEVDERDFDPNDPGPVHATYCEACTRAIEKEHERHDEDLKAFRDELDGFGRPSRPNHLTSSSSAAWLAHEVGVPYFSPRARWPSL